MARGVSLHIGLNAFDPGHYAGRKGTLKGCESDAAAMKRIAESLGFDSGILLTPQAKRQAVREAIQAASGTLHHGDILFVSYAGHGSQVPDLDGDDTDWLDETWCLYDGQLIDDELAALWTAFEPGVRILVVSDSCHSGTVVRDLEQPALQGTPADGRGPTGRCALTPRTLTPEAARETYLQNREFYRRLQANTVSDARRDIEASVLLLSACMDDQVAYDGNGNGLFTDTLLKVWSEGRFRGDYTSFHEELRLRLPEYQTPNLWTIGQANPVFLSQKPFTIDGGAVRALEPGAPKPRRTDQP